MMMISALVFRLSVLPTVVDVIKLILDEIWKI